jgi:uncharacterized protein (DUF433 family)
MTTTNVPLIRIDAAGVAWIEGTTAKVLEVVLTKLADDLTPEQVQAELPHLSLAQVYAALAYYDAHQAEMDAEIARQRAWVEELRAQEQNPLSRAELQARLRRRG